MPGPIAVKLRVLRQAGSYAEGGGAACQRISLNSVLPGVRQTSSLHADRDEDRQGIRRARRGVGGCGVASRTIPAVAPISHFASATLCANFAQTEFSEAHCLWSDARPPTAGAASSPRCCVFWGPQTQGR